MIGSDKRVKLILVYPMTTGRNFDEVGPGDRLAAADRQTPGHDPVNWKPGEDVIIAGSVSNEEAMQIFGSWNEPKPYLRIVPQPALLDATARAAARRSADDLHPALPRLSVTGVVPGR